MVRAVACGQLKQEDLGSIPAQTKWFFLLLGHRRQEKMDPDIIKFVILGIQVDK